MTQATSVETLLSKAYTSLSSLAIENAEADLNAVLQCSFDNAEALYALKCISWWRDSLEKTASMEPFESGEYLKERWKVFSIHKARFGAAQERVLSAVKHFVFGTAFEHYVGLTSDGETNEPELLLRLGQTSKGKGDYASAQGYLEAAAKLKRDDAAVLAELADVYELLGEQRPSKALFREAFFINPQCIDLALLDSAMITRLADKAAESGKQGIEIAEWIPVLGELLAVFSVKRELKQIEVSKLKQSLYELESELAKDSSRRAVLVPRLINRYFWLIDYYMQKKEEKSVIDGLLLKIKLLDPAVYKQYIA